ncbi:hypothetical protein DUNSADRAFT_17796 [Dunaliella salina]|uniref:Uncharacterized protein n=1 Tax=Dunaliella salina TaxID=3046 RepID=A0ABQ7G138_DUNSA|nr:hypothetical protein DUNSADRAFT_17796 [Dunaliella salina]|eukprot:KAF5828312.1 hypothetical protein DUNSADRAFT_17796 [Dunaliella salina]
MKEDSVFMVMDQDTDLSERGCFKELVLHSRSVANCAQVKSEQEREVKRMEEEAYKRYRFKAKPIPSTVTEPKYERMLMEAEATRQINREGRMSELAG